MNHAGLGDGTGQSWLDGLDLEVIDARWAAWGRYMRETSRQHRFIRSAPLGTAALCALVALSASP